jgi:RNA polymerase sigma-70 factor (ECF subfamily)
MQLRGKGHQPVLLESFPEDIFERTDSQKSVIQNENWLEQQSAELNQALQEISHDQKICIELFYFQKLSYKEIEQKTGYSFQQVKSHIQNGKRNLRIILEQKQKAPGHE